MSRCNSIKLYFQRTYLMTLQAPKLWCSRQATVSNLITPSQKRKHPKIKDSLLKLCVLVINFVNFRADPVQKRNQAEEAKDNPGMKLEDFFPSPPNPGTDQIPTNHKSHPGPWNSSSSSWLIWRKPRQLKVALFRFRFYWCFCFVVRLPGLKAGETFLVRKCKYLPTD